MAITTWAATTGDWNDSKFDRGWDGPSISPDAGLLLLAPSWDSNTNTWAAETEDWEQGLEPSYNFGINYFPGVASLEVIQSYEWNQLTATWDTVIGDWSSGPIPHVAIGTNIAPAKGDVTLTGSSAPTVGIQYNFPVTVGELTVTGSIPSVGEALHITPAVGSIDIIQSYEWDQMGAADWNDTTYSWDTGPSPNVNIGTGIAPAKADLTLTGVAPSQTLQIHRKPAKSDLTLTGSIPGWNFGKEFDVDKADIQVLQSYNWNTYGGTWADAATDWETAGSPFIPTAVEEGKNQPANADLTLSATAPSVTEQKLWYVPTQDLTLSTTAPDAPIGPIVEPPTAELTIVQAYDWNNYGGTWANATTTWNEDVFAPRAEETQHEAIPKGDLTLSGQIPVASERYQRLVPVAADITLTGYAPPFGISHFRSPGKGDITGLSSATWDNYGGTWAESSDNWGVGTLSPTVGITYTFPIDEADLTLGGYSPVKVKKDPTYLANVIVS